MGLIFPFQMALKVLLKLGFEIRIISNYKGFISAYVEVRTHVHIFSSRVNM